MELQILDLIQNMRTPVGDMVMMGISALGNAGAVWILLAAVLLAIPGKRRTGFILAAALLADLILCNGILKNVFARPRPCDVNTAVQMLIARPSGFSFPSGHTAASFASAAALWCAGERKLWPPALILACLIAFSRMYLYVHYPTDILGGVVFGALAGYLGYRVARRLTAGQMQN